MVLTDGKQILTENRLIITGIRDINKKDIKVYIWGEPMQVSRVSLVAQMVKNLPAMWESWVQFLSQEALLEKEMATHSSTLAWRIPWREEPGGLQFKGSQRVKHN